MHFQRLDVALVETRIAADLDVIGASGRVGKDAVGLEHANGVVAEHPGQALLQDVHRITGTEGLGLVFQVTTRSDVVEVVREHQAEVGQGRITGMKGVGGSAIQLLADQTEVLGATRLEHADDHAVFLAHAPHDLPDRVELAELTGDVALDVLEFQFLRGGIEGQRPTQVVVAIDGRRLLALGLEKAVTDAVVPLHRIEYPDGRLCFDDAVTEGADTELIVVQFLLAVHCSSYSAAR